jgi:hypothetical protein
LHAGGLPEPLPASPSTMTNASPLGRRWRAFSEAGAPRCQARTPTAQRRGHVVFRYAPGDPPPRRNRLPSTQVRRA